MAGGISYYLQNTIINHVLRNTPATSGSETWFALYTSNPTKADTGTEVPFTNGYARAYIKQQISSASPWTVSDNGSAFNSLRVDFPTPTGNWGTITHWGLRDAPTGGNLYYYGALTTGSGFIRTGNNIIIFPGNVEITLYTDYLGTQMGWYTSVKMFNHLLNKVPYTSPGTSIYGALYYISPDTAPLVEFSGKGYNRAQMTNWLSPVSGSTYNISGSVTFCSSATDDWEGEAVQLRIYDAAVAGNILYVCWVPNSGQNNFTIKKYDKFVINEGEIMLHIDLSNST
jgi:hypothetical protein